MSIGCLLPAAHFRTFLRDAIRMFMRARCSLLCASLLAALLGCGVPGWDAAGDGGWGGAGGEATDLGSSSSSASTSSASTGAAANPPPHSSWGDGCPVDTYVLELQDGTTYVFLIPVFCDPRPYIEMGTPPPPVVAPF